MTQPITLQIPKIQFRSKSIISYGQYHYISNGHQSSSSGDVLSFKMSNKFRKNAELLKKREKYTGQITAGSKRRLTKAVSLLVQSSPQRYQYNPVTKKEQYHKLSFITLTLPDVEKSKDAAFCHKFLLQPMLRILRNKFGMKSYVWKCELQKNGSVHYHITTELFIVWTDLRNQWNSIVRSHGLLDTFRVKYKHDNPNSVDVHSVNQVNDMEAYLVKYVSKEYQNDEKLSGKVWDCSKNLKEAKYYSNVLDYNTHRAINTMISDGTCVPFYSDRFTILKFKTTDYYLTFNQHIINDYYSHLNSIQSWTHQSSKKSGKDISVSGTELNISTSQKNSSLLGHAKKLKSQLYLKSSQLEMQICGNFYSLS